MNFRQKFIAALVVFGFMVLGIISNAHATPTLLLSNGSTTVIVADGGVGDANPAAGAVTFIGGIGNYTINVTTGLTKPAIGTLGSPQIDINNVSVSTGGGALLIAFSEVNFTAPVPTAVATSAIGGTINGPLSLSAAAFLDNSNTLFGTGTTLAVFGPFTSLAFAATSSTGVSTVNPFSLTQAVLLQSTGRAVTSFDFNTQLVPEPMSLLLLGSGLAGLGLIARRRNKA